MDKIEWSDVMWTNPGVFLTDLNRPEMIYTGLHYQYRGSDDKNHFDRILNREHELDPKAKFRISAYKAIGI